MKTHTTKGAKILEQVPDLRAGDHRIVRSHHERWDGRAIPTASRAKSIPRLARIVAVADAFDAMTSDRPYRPACRRRRPSRKWRSKRAGSSTRNCATAFLDIRAASCRKCNADEEDPRRPETIAPCSDVEVTGKAHCGS